MTDVDTAVRSALDRDVPLRHDTEPDWADVVARAAPVTRRRRRSYAVLVAAVVALGLTVSTPLAGAIRDTVADFSQWLRGTPGEPVSPEEQQAFDDANRQAYTAFPGTPELRRLIRTTIDGVEYDLLGFRSGGSLCIRIVATGDVRGKTLKCAPVADLANDDAPSRVLVADWGIGRGEKRRTIGFDTIRSSRAQITAGLTGDGVERIELVDDHGTHDVEVASNAFLYVAREPEIGQRVHTVRARLDDGRTVGVPFSPAPWGPTPAFGGAAGAPGGPSRVERRVEGGRIGWVERRETRGEPIETAFSGHPRLAGHVRGAELARVLTPDSQSAKRIVILLFDKHPMQLPPEAPQSMRERHSQKTICSGTLTGGGGFGYGCSPVEDMFDRGPFTFGWSMVGGNDQFATFAGAASDEVARLEIYTATGNRIPVPLRDNAFLVEVAVARFPLKMVAFDSEGRVIGLEETPRNERSTVVGEPILRLRRVTSDGILALRVHRTKEGGRCWFARGTGTVAMNASSCTGASWAGPALRLGTLSEPPILVYGSVRPDVVTVVAQFADGDTYRFEPEPQGYVLELVPPEHRQEGERIAELRGLDASGEVVARIPFPKPE